jgi:hypothetical protein
VIPEGKGVEKQGASAGHCSIAELQWVGGQVQRVITTDGERARDKRSGGRRTARQLDVWS